MCIMTLTSRILVGFDEGGDQLAGFNIHNTVIAVGVAHDKFVWIITKELSTVMAFSTLRAPIPLTMSVEPIRRGIEWNASPSVSADPIVCMSRRHCQKGALAWSGALTKTTLHQYVHQMKLAPVFGRTADTFQSQSGVSTTLVTDMSLCTGIVKRTDGAAQVSRDTLSGFWWNTDGQNSLAT